MATIATTGDVSAVQGMARDKAIRYATDPKSLERDIKQFTRLIEKFRKAVQAVWGKKEAKEPKPKEYVKYTQNYLSRASVDFDKGIITVETLDQAEPFKSLKNAVVATVLTPDDPRAVDLYSAKTIKLGETPFLLNEVKDLENKPIRWGWRAERYADHLVNNALQKRHIVKNGKKRTIHFVKIPMVKDHHQIRAKKYKPLVDENASRFAISRNLVYAIIKTESDFNPYAVSNAPAFGLMQIVPTTAGRDVHQFLNKKSGLPSKQFLFTPKNNIEYGTAYLHLLNFKYLDGIKDPVSREYCVIAAYNGGAGNVLRTFDNDRDRAPQKINNLAPLEVFNTLREKLPSKETRRYLVKVMDAKKSFVNF
jgi:membrane-bound lytic murein transglycosylase C